MKKYTMPELEVANFSVEDIVTVSGGEVTTPQLANVTSADFTYNMSQVDFNF